MQYSAGLIETGQCLHAIKFLMNINEYFNEKEKENEGKGKKDVNTSFKEQWLILIGKMSIYYTRACNKQIDDLMS